MLEWLPEAKNYPRYHDGIRSITRREQLLQEKDGLVPIEYHPTDLQRMHVCNGELLYEHMGAAECDLGQPELGLAYLMTRGYEEYLSSFTFNGHEISLFVLAGQRFDIKEYRKYPQAIVDGKRMHRPANLIERLSLDMGAQINEEILTNVWFDFRNLAIFTVSEEYFEALKRGLLRMEQQRANGERWYDSSSGKEFRKKLEHFIQKVWEKKS